MGRPPKSEAEFVAFYAAHWSRLAAAMSLVLPPGEEAVDVAQEAFVRAYEHWDEVSEHPRPEGWLFLTAYRIAGGLRRRATTAARLRPGGNLPDEWPADPASPIGFLGSLSSRQRAVLVLRHHYGYSTKETAAWLGCAEGTVKSLSARARDALRTQDRLEGSAG